MQKKIEFIVKAFLLSSPFLDMLTAFALHVFKTDLTMGIVIRILFLIFSLIYLFFFYQGKKKKLYKGFSLSLIIYILFFMGIVLVNKGSDVLFYELKNVFKTFYFPFLLISFSAMFEKKLEIVPKKYFSYIMFTYLLGIFIPSLLGIGFDTYEVTKKGSLGFFNSANEVEESDKGIFYNPADSEIRNLIISGVEEILDNYDVDGIHYDDYFYPSKTIDLENYQEELLKRENLTIDEYRLENTTKLIEKTYEVVKKKDKNILFGISPEGNIDNNYTSNYIDTKKFAGNSGYVDYLMPQIYFGFFNSIKPFYETVKEWNSYIKTDTVKLIPALAFYKVGEEDLYAKDGQYEWIEYNNIIAREVLASRPLSNYQGFAIFRYDSIFNDNLTSYAFKEKENLKKILK